MYNLRARKKRREASVAQANAKEKVSHNHEIMSRVWRVNTLFYLTEQNDFMLTQNVNWVECCAFK